MQVEAGPDQQLAPGVNTANLAGSCSNPAGGGVSVHWSVLSSSSTVTISDPTILNPTITIESGSAVLQLTVTSLDNPDISASDTVTITSGN
jgi:hypothetical protein